MRPRRERVCLQKKNESKDDSCVGAIRKDGMTRSGVGECHDIKRETIGIDIRAA